MKYIYKTKIVIRQSLDEKQNEVKREIISDNVLQFCSTIFKVCLMGIPLNTFRRFQAFLWIFL